MKKTIRLIALLAFASVFSLPAMRADDAAKDKPAKDACCCCCAGKDGKSCAADASCCCDGKNKKPEKVMPKSSYNRKS